jgi:hypothetical protein
VDALEGGRGAQRLLGGAGAHRLGRGQAEDGAHALAAGAEGVAHGGVEPGRDLADVGRVATQGLVGQREQAGVLRGAHAPVPLR